jgi:hypothetical protein
VKIPDERQMSQIVFVIVAPFELFKALSVGQEL